MCGITGYVSDEVLDGRRMIDALAHRGPDHTGTYQVQLGGRQTFLGHTRLSIIDLSEAGWQPMAAIEGDVTIVYNGEVYNFQELKARYLKAYPFRSRTDTEVLLYLYCELGPDFVKQLNGDFAIAILDERAGQLLLYRDRLGVKPLYYYRYGNTFAFASEIKAFLAAGLQVTLSEESLHRYFVYKYVPGYNTLYHEVKRVGPGCYLTYDLQQDQLVDHRYWQPVRDETVARASYADLKVRLHDLMEDAVRIRLISDVPVGTFLSGGVDSSTIAYHLKDQPQIIHYCARKEARDIRKEGTSPDFDYARRLADEWGITLRAIDISSAEATSDQIRRTLYYSDDLISDGSQIPSYLITRDASETSRVMLSGMGADEIFIGYSSHMLALLAIYLDWLPRSLSLGVTRGLGRLSQGRGAFKAYRRYLHLLGKYYDYPAYKYAAWSIVGDLENSMRVCSFDGQRILDELEQYFPADGDPFDSITRFEMENFLVKNLHYLDRMCMANSMEGRVPFMDHRVVEFALSLRRSHKLSGWGRTKRIMKDTYTGRLPDYILKRLKAGFGMPLRSIFSDRAHIERLLDMDFLSGFSFFDLDHIRTVIENHLSGWEDNASIIYALVSFQEWYRLFQEQDAVVFDSI